MNETITLLDLIKAGTFLNVDAKNTDEFFEKLGDELKPKGLIKDTFVEAIKNREAKYPTGLLTDQFPVALPHVDAENVNTNAIVICHLDNEIPFKRMDKSTETLDIKLAFVMLISDVKQHTKAISELVRIFTTNGALKQLYEAKCHKEVIKIIEELSK